MGWSYSLGLERAANAIALANCARLAPDCEVALAVGGGVVPWAWTAPQSRTEAAAKAECVIWMPAAAEVTVMWAMYSLI